MSRYFTIVFFLCLDIFNSGESIAQCLSGTYTIGGVSPDYTDISSAIDDLDTSGVCGPVVLNIRDGLYNEQFQIGKIAGTDTVNTITLTSESGDSSAVVVEYFASGSLNYIVSLTNTQHFVLAELTLRALNPSYCRVVYLEDTITNVILRNCRFEGVQVTTTNSLRAVIFTQNSTSHLVNKLHILDNVVLNGSIGMGLFQYGGSTEQYIIRGNSVMEFFSFGMAISKIHQVKVEDNYVSTTSPDCVGGIQMNRCDSSFTVTNNYIHLSNLVKFLWPGGIKGIDLKICRPDSSNRAIISNNSVIMGGVAYSHGIYVSGCDYNNIYNNSVHVKTTHPFASAFYISAGDSCRYMNNIFYNSGGGMVVKSSNWAANNTGSHNDIYTTGALIGRYQYENLTTIQDWRDSTGYDSISFAIDPVFSSDTDLHSNQVLLNNRGTPTPEVSYDMDGETRNSSTPDIGADEFIPDSTDALVAKFVQPFVVCAGSNDVKVIVRNNGLDTLSYLTVNWSVNQVIQTPFIWSGALESGDTAIVNLGAYSFTHGVPYELWAWTSAPNLLVDANPSNDSATIDTLFSSMTGTYTIGGVSPDYVNISSAVSDLVAYGVCGPVIFSIRTGTYNEQVRLPAIQNATLTNDITFTSETGDSTDVVWTYAATLSSARYTLSIDNARHINISKLTLKGTGPYAHVIEIPGGIDINISGCEVESIDTNIYSPRQGIGCGGDSITIVGNVIRYGTEGVSMGNCDNCTVSNNVIIDPFSYAIDVSQSDNLVIEKNNATTKYPVTGYPTTGIRVGNSSTIQLTNNLLDGSGFSIEFCDAALPPYKSLIANNFISTSTRGIFSSNNSDVDYYHNSVHVHTNGISDCFRYKGDDTSVVVKNNILANLAGGFTIYRESGVIKSDYNDLYSSGASIGYYFGARSTLSEWITLTKLDSNSINEDPQFLAPPDLHVANLLLNARGTPLSNVNFDIDNESRSLVQPDLGADEFLGPTEDASALSIDSTGNVCLGGSPVYVTIQNNGEDTLVSLVIDWTVNGVLQSTTNWIGSISLYGTASIFIGNYSFQNSVPHEIMAWASMPNGITDTVNYNDTTRLTVKTGLIGSFTIGGMSPDYLGLTDAVTDLNTRGVCGPVVFNIRDGSYNEQVIIQAVLGASTINTITFQSESGDSSSVKVHFSAGNLNNYIIQLNGTDHIRILRMTLTADPTQYGKVINMVGECTDIVIANNVIVGDSLGTNPNRSSAIYGMGALVSNCSILMNDISRGYFGIKLSGAFPGGAPGVIIRNNRITELLGVGVELSNANKPYVMDNYVAASIHLSGAQDGFVISGNTITTDAGIGINLQYYNGVPSDTGLISNNFIRVGNQWASNSFGVIVRDCWEVDLIHNTVLIKSDVFPTGAGAALRIFNSYKTRVRNNIIVNEDGNYIYQFIGAGGSSNNFFADYNNVSTSGDFYSTVSGSTLSSWQADSSQDLNSVALDPLFNASEDLHINEFDLVFAGSPSALVPFDIDDELRNVLTPSIGADEWVLQPTDASVVSVYDGNPMCEGLVDVFIKIKNFGTDTLASANVNWEVNGVPQTPFPWSGNLATGQIDSVIVGQYSFSFGNYYNFKSWTSLPNGAADDDPSNDSLYQDSLRPALSGTYTIGGISPDYTTLTAAVSDVNNYGVCSPVVFNIRSGTYVEQVVIGDVIGVSAMNTITFQAENGINTSVLVQYNGTATENYTIHLQASEYVRWRNLSIQSSNTTYGTAVLIDGGASFNEFHGNRIIGVSSVGCTSAQNVVHSSGSYNDQYNVFRNNLILNGNNGIYLEGMANVPAIETGNIIDSNVFQSQCGESILAIEQRGVIVISNTIRGGDIGIDINNCVGANIVSANKLTNITGTGIKVWWVASDSLDRSYVSNNMVHIAATNSSTGLDIGFNSNITVQYNSINVIGSDMTSRACSTKSGNGIVVRNNIFVNQADGYALHDGAGSSSLDQHDYNVYHSSGPFLVRRAGLEMADLSSWQVFSGFDSSSYEFMPLFYSDSNLHVITDFRLNGKAFADSTGTPYDFDGDIRNSSTPDIGADEFAIQQVDLGLPELIDSLAYCDGLGSIDITFVNFGSDTIDSATIHWELNGIPQVPYSWVGLLAHGDTSNPVTIGSYTASFGAINSLTIWAENPNGQMDQNNLNDTLQYTDTVKLGGTYTIGGQNPDFADITSAVSLLNTVGICANTVFNIRPGTYEESISITKYDNSANYSVTFQSEQLDSSSVVVHTEFSINNSPTVLIDGGQNIIFQHLTLRSNGQANGRVIELQNDAENFTVRNNILHGIILTNYFTSTPSDPKNYAVIFSESSAINGIYIEDNNIFEGGYGIYMSGSFTSNISNINIKGNTILNSYQSGISISYTDSLVVSSNRVTSDRIAAWSGIALFKTNGYTVSQNHITSSIATKGIYIFICDNSIGGPNLIQNNYIHLGAEDEAFGIYCWASDIINIYHNTVKIKANYPWTSASLGIYYGSGISILNNVLIGSGGSPAYNIDPSAVVTSDYNCLFSNGPNLGVAGSVAIDLPALQSLNGHESNSIERSAVFINQDDFHLIDTLIDGSGTYVGNVLEDLEGDVRDSNAVDIGADAFDIFQEDVGLFGLSPESVLCPDTHVVSVSLTNQGLATITSAEIQVLVNGIPQTPITWNGSIQSGDTLNSFSLGTFIASESSTVEAWISAVNGNIDPNPLNDTVKTNRLSGELAGDYTIGGLDADFRIIEDALDSLEGHGICGPVNLKFRSGVYNMRAILPYIPGSSFDNEITIQSETGLNTDVTCVKAQGDSMDAILQLTGAMHYIIRDLSFAVPEPIGSGYFDIDGWALTLDNGSTNNLITNNIISGKQCTTMYCGNQRQVIRGYRSPWNEISYNTFMKGTWGIYWKGLASSIPDSAIIIKGNTMLNSSYGGIDGMHVNSMHIEDNFIELSANTGIFKIGVRAESCHDNLKITGNKMIGDLGIGIEIWDNLPSSYAAATLISNNFISSYDPQIWNGGWTISVVGSEKVHLYNNNVRSGVVGGVGTWNCVARIANSTEINVINNNFFNDGGNYIFFTNGSGSPVLSSVDTFKHNNLYATSNIIGNYYQGIQNYSFAAWQATTQGANSLSVDPMYTSNTDLHINNWALQSAGLPLPEIIVDIDMEARDAWLPDIGADELYLNSNDIGATSIIQPTTPCPQPDSIMIELSNFIGDTLVYAEVHWSVNDSIQSFIQWNGNLPPGQSTAPFLLSVYDFSGLDTVDIKVWTSRPNWDWDSIPGNDTISGVILVNQAPVVILRPDTMICAGDTVFLNAGSGYASYLWQDSSTDSILYASNGGTYYVQITDSNACIAVDSFNLTTLSLTIDLGSDTGLCNGDTIELAVSLMNMTYLWSTTATDSSITIDTGGTYWVEVTDSNFCRARDSINIAWNSPPNVYLGVDSTICGGDSFLLDAGPSGQVFNWSTGDTSQVIFVTDSGQYSVMISDSNNCFNADSVNISVYQKSVLNLGNDSSLCDSSFLIIGGNQWTAYLWSTGDTTSSIEVQISGPYSLLVTDSNQCSTSDSVSLSFLACNEVWPGDANNDLVADNFDLLQIGLYYNQSGTVRDSIDNTWIGHTSIEWPDTQLNGANLNYADCNGDGIVDDGDTLAISINFGLTHNKWAGSASELAGNIPIAIVLSQSSYSAGDTVQAEVWIGDSTTVIDSLYGVAFNLSYDESHVESGSFEWQYIDNWILSPISNGVHISKIFDPSGSLKTAISRTDHMNSVGYGPVGTLEFRIAQSFSSTDTLHITFPNAKGVTAYGDTIDFFSLGSEIFTDSNTTSITDKEPWDAVHIYPNPAKNEITVDLGILSTEVRVAFVNSQGIELYNDIIRKKTKIDVDQWAAGVYYSILSSNSGVSVRKIVLIK